MSAPWVGGEASARLARGTLVAGLLVAGFNLLCWLAGAAPSAVWAALLAGTVGNPYGLAQTIAKATPLALTGAAVALALRAGLFNIGAEGQVTAGVLAAAVVGAHLPAGAPASSLVLAVALAAAAAGGALGALTGYLRARFGAHEVLTALMLNGLAQVTATYLYGGPLRFGAQVHTPPLPASARLPSLEGLAPSLRGSALSAAVLLALALPFALAAWLARTEAGARLRAVGSNAAAARAVGIDVARVTTRAMALSGAVAGLAAVHYVAGAKGYAEEGLGAGAGFTGLAVAVLSRGSPAGVVLAALVLGALSQGGLAVNALVPSDVLLVAQGGLLLALAARPAGVEARG